MARFQTPIPSARAPRGREGDFKLYLDTRSDNPDLGPRFAVLPTPAIVAPDTMEVPANNSVARIPRGRPNDVELFAPVGQQLRIIDSHLWRAFAGFAVTHGLPEAPLRTFAHDEGVMTLTLPEGAMVRSQLHDVPFEVLASHLVVAGLRDIHMAMMRPI